jgi:hypothetical protein
MTFGEHAREFVSVESFFQVQSRTPTSPSKDPPLPSITLTPMQVVRNLTAGFRQPCSTYGGQYSRHVLDHLELHIIGTLPTETNNSTFKTP